MDTAESLDRARRIAEMIDDPDPVSKDEAGISIEGDMLTITEAVETHDGGVYMQSTTFPRDWLDATDDEIRAYLSASTEH